MVSDSSATSPELTVTALFADVSGFTALADRLDPDALHEIMSPVISGLANVAERSRGHIAKYAGDALLVIFGMPQPRDDDAARAVSVALEMHEELGRIRSDLPRDARQLELHIGLCSGQLVSDVPLGDDAGDPAILGDAVALAQRLESMAPAGETRVADATYRLTRDRFAFEPGGELPRADAPPMPTWRLLGVAARPRQGTASAQEEASARATEELARALAQLSSAEGEPVEERRLVTAVFADVAGFGALSDRLSPQELHRVITPLITRLAAVVEPYEGFVAKYAGDALLAFFGAPVAHEDDSVRALLAARQMHREMERILPTLPPAARQLRLRIGVNSGHVISGRFGGKLHTDYSILGDAVNLAQRLESVAPPGETYVGKSTFELARDRFEFEDLGGITLKGKALPVPAWRLLAERTPGEHATFSQGRRSAPLLGRHDEFATLQQVLDRLHDGSGGLMSVTGEPGVGKSRLTRELRDRAGERGIRWLDARCISYGGSLAYWPYADLLRRSLGIAVDETPKEAGRLLDAAVAQAGVPEAVGFFSRLIGADAGEAADAVAVLEPEAFRRGLYEAFASWMRAMAARIPIVVSIEDLHWADASTIGLTKELVSLSSGSPIAFYLTGRPEAEPVLEELAGAGGVGRVAVRLDPLGAEAIRSLVAWILDGEPPRGLVEAVLQRTGGNPFFAEEMVRSLEDAGTLFRREDRWRLAKDWEADAVPATVEGVLSARIDLLPKTTTGVLQTASVIGRRVRIPLLRAVSEKDAALDQHLGRLVDGGFLDPMGPSGEGDLYFHHALVQDVAYSRLLRRRRRVLHLKAAEEGERLYGAGDDLIDFLARHFYLGEAGAKAVDYLVRAGERAKRLFANDEAIVHFSRAAEISRSDPLTEDRLVGVLLDLADVQDVSGRYDDSLAAYTEVLEATGDLQAWRGAAAIHRKRGQPGEALALLDRAFSSLAPSQSGTSALWLERGWSLAILGRYGEAIEAFRSGLVSLKGRQDPVAGQLLVQLARAELIEGQADEALDHVLQAREVFEGLGDQRGLAVTMRILGDAYIELDRLDEAAEALRRGLGLAERVGIVEEVGGSLINLGIVEQYRGNLSDAIAHARRAIDEFERVGHEFGRATGYSNLAEALMLRGDPGDLDEATKYGQQAVELSRSIGFSFILADVQLTMARIRLQEGDPLDAAARAEEAGSVLVEMGSETRSAEAFNLAADALEDARDVERARELRARARSAVG